MTALVTGADSGIGLQYATVLARDYDCDLLLVSNRREPLEQTAVELAGDYGVNATPFYCDLAQQDAAQKVYEFAKEKGLPIDILINNAGIFFFNPLTETPAAKVETMVMLHVVTMTKLCRLFGADMCSRGKGYILNMSSLCKWMEFPGIQTYIATKTYIFSFSKCLWYEMRPKGVTVTAVTPGAVDTGLYGLSDRYRRLAVRLGVSLPPEKLASKALKSLFRGRKTCMPGLINHITIPLWRHFPDWAVFAAMRRMAMFNPPQE
ncbi:MAG: SDR family NAD(P)-dependent oxidoreductase [Bacteroidales bacterium]|nr:SDR family NAD(P)-dependent oxidoreductase [Bacteroidales bacterium]